MWAPLSPRLPTPQHLGRLKKMSVPETHLEAHSVFIPDGAVGGQLKPCVSQPYP